MNSIEIGKYISVFLACTAFFSKIGMPTAVAVFEFDYVKSVLTSSAGAIFSTVVFTYLSAEILKFWEKIKDRWFASKHKKKTVTKSNRRIIKLKQRFGLIGIAVLTPILLSIPLGAFLGERFFKDKKKVITYISISILVWSNILYFLFLYFSKFYVFIKSFF